MCRAKNKQTRKKIRSVDDENGDDLVQTKLPKQMEVLLQSTKIKIVCFKSIFCQSESLCINQNSC